MARVLAEANYQQVLPVLTAAELNEAYARLDERYNCLRSNWEWFCRADYAPAAGDPAGRMEQNWVQSGSRYHGPGKRIGRDGRECEQSGW